MTKTPFATPINNPILIEIYSGLQYDREYGKNPNIKYVRSKRANL
jgi:hypothetical protein